MTRSSNVLRSLIAAALTLVLAASLTLVSTPASACATTLRAPYKAGSPLRVATRVTNDNCNTNFTFDLERHRWWGWQPVAWKRVPYDSSAIISKNCADLDGTYTYRAAWGTSAHSHIGPTSRITC